MIVCPTCRNSLPTQFVNSGQFHNCADCLNLVRIEMFNAFHRSLSDGKVAEHIQQVGQAECFYHPGKLAVTPCAECGRLLCALCEISFDNRKLCMNCLHSGKEMRQLQILKKGFVHYDSIALHFGFWPLVLFPFIFFAIVSVPVIVVIVLRYWKAPASILPRTKFRYVLALIMAGFQVVGFGGLAMTLSNI